MEVEQSGVSSKKKYLSNYVRGEKQSLEMSFCQLIEVDESNTKLKILKEKEEDKPN